MSSSRPEDNPGYVEAELLTSLRYKVEAVKERTWELLRIGPGSRALDVGCGPGIDTAALGRIVGPEGAVLGVDYDPAMIEEAREKARQEGVDGWVRHEKADGFHLPCADGEFDAARSERVFQHVADPSGILAEMIRAVRPGGWIVVADTDWSTLSFDTPEKDVEWILRRRWIDRFLNGYSGRQLRGMFLRQGLKDVTVEVFPLAVTDYSTARRMSLMDRVEEEALAEGTVDAAGLERWRRSLEEADGEGAFLCSVNMLVVAGRRV